MEPKKMFVLVRKDIGESIAYPGVQAGHALAEYMIKYPECEWRNGYLIYLGVCNEKELQKWKFRLQNMDIPFACFHEPDLDDQITALAAYNVPIFDSLKPL